MLCLTIVLRQIRRNDKKSFVRGNAITLYTSTEAGYSSSYWMVFEAVKENEEP